MIYGITYTPKYIYIHGLSILHGIYTRDQLDRHPRLVVLQPSPTPPPSCQRPKWRSSWNSCGPSCRDLPRKAPQFWGHWSTLKTRIYWWYFYLMLFHVAVDSSAIWIFLGVTPTKDRRTHSSLLIGENFKIQGSRGPHMFVFVFVTTQLSIGKLQQLQCNLTEMMENIPGHGLNSDSWMIN